MVAEFSTMASGATWWPNLELLPAAQPGGQIWEYGQWRHVVVNFRIIASGTIWW